MTTKTGVLNGALGWLGQPPASGPSDTSTWVKRVTNVYPDSVRALLEGHPWNFAEASVKLERLSETPIGWDYAYNKPADFLRTNYVNSSGDPDDRDFNKYADAGGKILSSADDIYIWYISSTYLTKEGSWPQLFADAVSADCAARINPIATRADNKRVTMLEIARMATKKAKAFDASQFPFRELRPGKWAKSRRSGMRFNTEGN